MRLDYFDGGANLNPGARSGAGVPVLSEILSAPGSLHFHCDCNTEIPEEFQEGTPLAPYSSIQRAVDFIEETYDPKWGDDRIFIIRPKPGKYIGRVIITKSNISIIPTVVGQQQSSVQIRSPIDGKPGLILCNATRESIDKFLVTGDYADFVNIGDAGPNCCIIAGVRTHQESGYSSDIALYGVKGDASPDTTNFARYYSDLSSGKVDPIYGIQVIGCTNAGYLRARNANALSIFGCGIRADIQNCNNVNVDDSFSSTMLAGYDITSPYGYPSYEGYLLQQLNFNESEIYSGLTLSGNITFGAFSGAYNSYIGGTIAVNDTATLNSIRSTLGAVIVAGGASIDLKSGTRVTGNLTLASGPGTASMKWGSEYYATLSDPDGKLVYGASKERGFTKEGGVVVLLTNRTGVATVKGTVVEVGGANNSSFITATTSSTKILGVVYESGIANGQLCRIVVAGYADILVQNGSSITRGWYVKPSATVAGRVSGAAAAPGIWHCLQTAVSGTDVLAKCFFKSRPSS